MRILILPARAEADAAHLAVSVEALPRRRTGYHGGVATVIMKATSV